MENLRKRQLSPIPTTEPKKLHVKNEPMESMDDDESSDELPLKIVEEPVENPPKLLDLDEFPILKSMISAPVQKSEMLKIGNSGDGNAAVEKKKAGYLQVYTAFCQFLNGYVASGGDAHLANTLASYAAALPIPIPKPQLNLKSELDNLAASQETAENSENSQKILENSEDNGDKFKEGCSSSSIKPELIDFEAPDSTVDSQPKIEDKSDQEPPTEIQRLREAAFGRYRNVLCVICNEWICSRNRKNHLEAHLNYRPYKCSACEYARRREIFVVQHIKTHHPGQENVEMLTSVDLNVALEVDRLADECVERTRKLIDSMQEKKDGDFGEGHRFDEKALELMLAEDQQKKVVVIESVSEVRAKVANYHRRQRTKVLKKIYDTDAAKQTELKIVKDEEGVGKIGLRLEEGFEIKLEDLMQMVKKNEQEPEVQEQGKGDEVKE